MNFIRPEIAALQPTGIARVALPRLHDPSVIPLWFGEGDLVTPEFIRDEAMAALDDGETFYAFSRGTVLLREAIKNYLDRVYATDVHQDRITVPGSAMLCVTMAAQMVLSKGDHAVVASPHWPNIEVALQVAGAHCSQVRQRQTASGWQLDAAELIAAVRPATRCIYINSPCNPTGWVMSAEQQQALLAFCRERQIWLLADEMYHRMDYTADVSPSFLSIAEEEDPVMIFYGMSKSWAMTGWRLGWVVAPRSLEKTWQILSDSYNTGAAVFTQRPAAMALDRGEALVAELRDQYAAGRDIVMEQLGGHSRILLSEPKGAFYAFPRIEGISSSLDFALDLLQAEDVGVAPGYTFGPGNDQHVRICFARQHDQLREGLQRMLRFLDKG